MASMPGYHVSKGPFAFLDQRFDGTNPANYQAALAALGGSLQAAAAARFGAGDQKTQHFQNDWLGGANRWNALKPEETLRAGLTQAITKALQTNPPKPMEFFWICALDRDFHVYFSDGPRQVNVFIFTPPPLDPGGNPNSAAFTNPATLTTPENLFVVKKRDWEDNPPGSTYPGPITTLVPNTPPPPASIIMREIFR